MVNNNDKKARSLSRHCLKSLKFTTLVRKTKNLYNFFCTSAINSFTISLTAFISYNLAGYKLKISIYGQIKVQLTPSLPEKWFSFSKLLQGKSSRRPSSDIVLLPCWTKFSNQVRQKYGRSTVSKSNLGSSFEVWTFEFGKQLSSTSSVVLQSNLNSARQKHDVRTGPAKGV